MEDDAPKHKVVRMCPNCRMEWDVEAAPELCTECPNTELITVDWLPGSDHTHTGYGPRQVYIPVLLPLHLAIPFHNRVYVCFQRQSAKVESESEAEATEAKQAKKNRRYVSGSLLFAPIVLMQKSVCLGFQGHNQEGEVEATEAK